MKKIVCLIFAAVLIFSLTACGNTAPADLWQDAVYTQNTELGSGKIQIEIECKAADKSVTFTIKTDKETVGEALEESGLIPAGTSEFIKVFNGITADYDIDKSYWAFSKNGEYMMTGADTTKISDGEHYEFTHTK